MIYRDLGGAPYQHNYNLVYIEQRSSRYLSGLIAIDEPPRRVAESRMTVIVDGKTAMPPLRLLTLSI
jgi:hypothetical protein